MEETILQESARVLRALGSAKPWMTASGLSRKIKARTGDEFTPSDIECTLIDHSREEGRWIRYSHYPSKKTLDILWGHVDVVEERDSLAELDRIDEPTYEPCDHLANEAPWFFVSHNHRDFAVALELRRLISKHKCGAWLFETEIPYGQLITPLVKDAIKECNFFVPYVTRRSIGSLWVHKEFQVAVEAGNCETYVLIDGRDEGLLQVFEK